MFTSNHTDRENTPLEYVLERKLPCGHVHIDTQRYATYRAAELGRQCLFDLRLCTPAEVKIIKCKSGVDPLPACQPGFLDTPVVELRRENAFRAVASFLRQAIDHGVPKRQLCAGLAEMIHVLLEQRET